jgi:hypothetical protein
METGGVHFHFKTKVDHPPQNGRHNEWDQGLEVHVRLPSSVLAHRSGQRRKGAVGSYTQHRRRLAINVRRQCFRDRSGVGGASRQPRARWAADRRRRPLPRFRRRRSFRTRSPNCRVGNGQAISPVDRV